MKLVISFYNFSYLIKSFQDHFRNLFAPEDAQDQPLWGLPGTKDYFGGFLRKIRLYIKKIGCFENRLYQNFRERTNVFKTVLYILKFCLFIILRIQKC